MDRDERFFRSATDRLTRWMLLLAAAGCTVSWVVAGWRAGAGFLVGAAVSALNFRWLKQMVEALGENAPSRPRRKARLAILMGLRYGLLGLGAYVILITSALSVFAVLAGLFVAVAAVLVEIVFELVYARN
jgi:ATP synthase I chain